MKPLITIIILLALGLGIGIISNPVMPSFVPAEFVPADSSSTPTHTVALKDTTYFGNEVVGDFNADGMRDRAYLVTARAGADVYLQVYLAIAGGAQELPLVFIGTNIAPQATTLFGKTIVVNYAMRAPGESLDTRPSWGVSRAFQVVGGEIRERAVPGSDTVVPNPRPTTTPTPLPSQNNEPIACTMDARVCPDGSYVGRTGPKCEFAPCPGN